MSSHREAPEISKDPVADNTDTYAFVSPDAPDTVTLIANFIPLQAPQGGPNFFEFGDDVLYEIHISNNGDATPDVTYQFRFTTKIRNPKTFLYNTGPITKITDPTWNRPQTYTVTVVDRVKGAKVIAKDLLCPPVNVGVRSTPNYANLAKQAIYHLPNGGKVFAGQRADAFFVDLGSIFDLGVLRPFQAAHLIPSAAAAGVNGLQDFNVHSIAIQVKKTDLTIHGRTPSDPMNKDSVIGVWATASRQRSKAWDDGECKMVGYGSWQQVSRLGNPLFNEVVVPMAQKDRWNSLPVRQDSQFAEYVAKPEQKLNLLNSKANYLLVDCTEFQMLNSLNQNANWLVDCMRIEGARARVVCFTVVLDPLIGVGPISKYLPTSGTSCSTGLLMATRRYSP